MTTSTTANPNAKIKCMIDGGETHSIQHYLKEKHPGVTIEEYRTQYPEAPLLSPFAEAQVRKRRAEVDAAKAAAAAAGAPVVEATTHKPMHEVFGLGSAKAALSSTGRPIMVEIRGELGEDAEAFVPDVDPNYIFSIDLVKKTLAGRALNMPMYLWGCHGTGKTTCLEQVCARTNTPFMRVQHTVNTEEAHIVGQWTVSGGDTVFSYGPLPIAMLNGYTYCADEYDFAQPSVMSVYQAVLEGKPLVIKEAPPHLRVVRPHKDFRFVATGNTNGGGDETGLYQGTQLQNAANYSRFGIVEEVQYMEPAMETAVIAAQAQMNKTDAEALVAFAADVRKAFKGGSIGTTVSPRELIAAGRLGVAFGRNWHLAIKLAFSNRLSRIDRDTVDGFAQRCFKAA